MVDKNLTEENNVVSKFECDDFSSIKCLGTGKYISGVQKNESFHEYFLFSEDIPSWNGRWVCQKKEDGWIFEKPEDQSPECQKIIGEVRKDNSILWNSKTLPLLKKFEYKNLNEQQGFCLITKVNEEKRMVYGPVLIPEEVDGQGDIISKEVIQEAAWGFLEEYGTVGFMHSVSQTVEGIKHQVERSIDMKYSVNQLYFGTNDPMVPGINKILTRPRTFSDKLKVRESYLAPVEFKMGTRVVKEGSWVMGVHVINDLLWEDAKSGKLRGFSIGGEAKKDPTT